MITKLTWTKPYKKFEALRGKYEIVSGPPVTLYHCGIWGSYELGVFPHLAAAQAYAEQHYNGQPETRGLNPNIG